MTPETARATQLESLRPLAAPLAGLRVLLTANAGRGFPGGDGAAEAAEVLAELGIELTVTHHKAADLLEVLAAAPFDASIVSNTRIGELAAAPAALWEAAPLGRRALWFWDLRPGALAVPLSGCIDRAFLAYHGPWTAPGGVLYAPEQWERALGCPVGYAPQATALRAPRGHEGHRVVFVGDLDNPTYHRGRRELCQLLGATVINRRARGDRLAVEARLSELYPASGYALAHSPGAPGFTSVRTYSILACGGHLLINRFPGLDRLFADGIHCTAFDDAAEALERMRQLDRDDPRRRQIAAQGRRLHATRHTVAHRVVGMLRELCGIDEGFPGWL